SVGVCGRSGRVSVTLFLFGAPLAASGPSVDRKFGSLAQPARAIAERGQRGDRGLDLGLGGLTRARQPEFRNECRLAGVRVLPDSLAERPRIALDIQKIVADLEGEAEMPGIEGKRGAPRGIGAEDRARLGREADQRP